MSRYTRGLLAVMLAVVLVLPAAAFAMLPEANARSSTGMDGPTVSGKIVDPNTSDNWTYWAAGSDGSGKITTQNVGRIWTDKTVEAGEESDFVTTLSAISSTSNTITTVPKPLDIVMVLDASGSMDDPMSSSDRTKRIDALKTAANSFIEKIAEENAKISDESKRHQVAIVKFAGDKTNKVGNDMYGNKGYTYNYSQVMKEPTLCKDDGVSSLKSTVNSIKPAGATRADYGMDLAESISDREDAKKVVLFFTDGSPTSYSSFESSVADSAINKANSLKKDGTVIYTIGIFSGANPAADPTASGTINENKFMHAVSSNYPTAASSISFWGEWTINFGARSENANYYKSAKNAKELEDIFKDISESITEVVGYPTEVHDGYGEHKSGYITFTDELGDFMQVDDFTEVEYNGTTFKDPEKSTKGNVDNYTFAGEAANLVITVQRAAEGNPQQGDIVEVKIPASLIPLRKFDVDETKGTLKVSDVEPIRVKYASSVKDIARENLFTPDEALKKYIDKNTTDEQGSKSVAFYANKWNGDLDLGDTIANFKPAATNRYYFFQKQTPIYVDPACTQPAKGQLESERHYYYQDEFEVADGSGKLDHGTTVIGFAGGHAAQFAGAVVKDESSGNLSFSEGTARLAFIDELHTDKKSNATEIASDVLNPRWNDTSSKESATHVDSHLGNNGKISFDVTPATVDTKADFGLTKVLEGRDWTGTDEFAFELSATSGDDTPMPASTDATVRQGNTAIDFGEIAFNKPGEYTYEVREVKGTLGGIAYSDNVAKITVKATVDTAGKLTAEVTKSKDKVFTNTYSVKPDEFSVTDQITATKVLTGRELSLKADEFSFELVEGEDEDAKVVATGTNDAAGNITMGAVEYTKPGKHTYTLREVKGDVGGITYSTAEYTIVTTITDNGDGTLKAEHVLKEDKKAEFTNSYKPGSEVSSVTDQITATKVLTGRDLKADEFSFELVEGEGEDAKVVATGTNVARGKITMNPIEYTEAGEHTYTLREANGGTASNGITYDGKTYTIVTTITDNGDGTLSATHKLQGANEAKFNNSYKPNPDESSVTDQITATKVLDGRDLKEGEFHFELVEGNDVVAAGTNDAEGNITMIPIEYTAAGEHTYTLREVKGNAGGITYDGKTYTVVTTITDNGDGTLSATHVLKDVGEAKFVNSYKPGSKDSSVTDQITATKSLDGRDLKAGEFRFELVEGNDVVATGTNNADGKIVMDPVTYTAAGEHTYTLRETKAGATENGITYSTAEYTIVTTVTDNGDGTLIVEHKLQNNKKATFENAYNVTPKSSSVTDQVKATKSLTGRDLKASEFHFELVEGNDVVATGTNAADGKIAMSEIAYTEAGKHTYTLREVPGDAGNGITYDDKTYTIETTITDKGDGTLVAKHELKGDNEAKFSNSYKPNPDEFSVTDQITAAKFLDGRELKAGEFSFELVEGNDVVATGTNDAEGNITMSAVKYTAAGKHTYTLREANGGTTSKGITYSDAKFTIETTITDNGDGTLKAEHVLKGDATAATFKNTYSVTPLETEVDFDLSKAIDGRDWTDTDEFSFTISPAEGTDAPLPDPATVTVSKKNADDNGIAAIKFGKIRYTAAGTYKYEIRENAGNAAGMTYDEHAATAEVTVTEDGEGKLIANVTKKENGRFTNTYRTELNYTAAGGLKLSKSLSGRPMTEGQFTFTVTPADEASANALGLLPGANNFKSPATAEATVGLIDILAGHEVKFTQADAGKTFTYAVAEKNDGKPGYTYDDAVRTVTIAIADDGAGTLTATTTVSGGPEGTHTTVHKSGENKVESALVPFHNSYSATTNTPGGTAAQVVATKTLTGRPMVDGEFWFGIAYAGETEAIDGTCVTNIKGHVSFGVLHYTTEMLADLVNAGRAIRTDTDAKPAWTINYTAFEYTSPLAAKGITAATPSFSFKVIVVDNGDGTLTATPVYDGVKPEFKNVYGADAVDAALAGTKKLQAAKGLTPADIAGKFTFTVTADEAGAPMPEHATATNDAAGNVDFGKIHFTLDDLNRALGVTTDASDDASNDAEANADEAEVDADAPDTDESNDESEPAASTAPRSHTFTYTVTESGSAPGVTNDANATRKVSYTVTDDRAGHLSVVREGDDGAAFTFTNTYSVAPADSSVTDQVKTVKRLTGRDLVAGEFTFELLEDDVVVASGTNDVNGTVTLSPIHYEAPGTHTYTLREACPNALGLYKGVTYDGATYTVVTTVSDNGDGTLTATHKLEGTTESAGFTNKYHAMPTQVSIGAIKVLEGRELKKDEFSFKLVGEDIESTVTNDADGKINFDKFEYDEPGTYVYTISEVKGDETGMTYDKSVFTATVNVVDDGEGNLKASVAYTKGDKSVEGIVFNNTYKKPETPVPTPDPGTPKTVTNIVKTVKGFLPTTGDQQAAALLMAFVIAMSGVGALIWGIRKR
ncbi:MAG: Spy0128 family protein [Collinsella sp.]